MIYKRKLLPLLIAAAFASGCAYLQPKPQTDDNGMRIESVMKVSGASAKAASMYQLGRYYQAQNRYEQAITAYQKSLVADAQYTESYNGLGVIYSRQAQYDAAIAEFTRALVLAPQADHIHNNLGYAQYLQGDNVAAIASFEQALQFNPQNQRAAKNLALAQAKLGMPQTSAATDDKAQLASAQPSPNTQDAWQVKAPQPSAGALGQRGEIVRAEQSALEVKQIAPAVYELRRYETPTEAAQPARLQIGKIEVSNGNGVLGMARRVGGYLKQQGFTASRITNHKPFDVEKTQVQYRSGYQAQARALQAKIPGEPALVQRDDLRPGIQLRLVLGQDLATQPDFYK
jgi:tetratricopeptide (TPR) repeat protein